MNTLFIFIKIFFRSGSKWCHVSCALWIPEVRIGCPDKMEPIQNISIIPVSTKLHTFISKMGYLFKRFIEEKSSKLNSFT